MADHHPGQRRSIQNRYSPNMSNLFDVAGMADTARPLADRLRPTSLDQVMGQDHAVGPKGPIGRMVSAGRLGSLILWGPPGTGKTTIAKLLAASVDLRYQELSAVFSGVADLKKAFAEARAARDTGRQTLLFIDEIHRFNRAQQDAFLPVVEDGTIVLVGATTENPSFELNAALLSRAQVVVLHRLDEAALETLLERSEIDAGKILPLDKEARTALKAMADGDGRFLLTMAEALFSMDMADKLTPEGLTELLQRRAPLYDKGQDGHYNLISALHKSVRGSDPDAALYWLARMLSGGEDPLYIARRVIRMAYEDIGMADPAAAIQALAARDAFEQLGSPEGELAIAQSVVYCATAPKSNALYSAYKGAMRSAKETGSLMPPKIILNAPTKLMKQEGHGSGYAYDHDAPDGFSGQNYFPEEIGRQSFYGPVDRGFEREIAKRLAYWDRLRKERGEP